MKKVYFGTLILLTSVCGFLPGCNNDETPSSSSVATGSNNNGSLGATTPTGIVTHRDFTITFDPGSAIVFDKDGYHGGAEATITISASDIHDLVVDGQTINFRTEWGTFPEGDACVLSNGICSVRWLPGDYYNAPSAVSPFPSESVECRVAFTAWTIGEEKFADTNDNGVFDVGESFFDLPEPYLDINENGIYQDFLNGFVAGWDGGAGFCNTDGVCELIDINNDGNHNPPDGLYNGSLCASNNSAQCSTATSTYIWTTSYLMIGDEYDVDDNPATPDTVFCGAFKL